MTPAPTDADRKTAERIFDRWRATDDGNGRMSFSITEAFAIAFADTRATTREEVVREIAEWLDGNQQWHRDEEDTILNMVRLYGGLAAEVRSRFGQKETNDG